MGTKKTTSDPDEPMSQMPPQGEEGKDPAQAAVDAREATKSDDDKRLEAAANARNATGGQGALPPLELSEEQKAEHEKRVSADSLASSPQPRAPEYPLEVPDEPKP